MELVFLGTSAAVPTKERNLPSIMILFDGDQIMFDAGEDVQRRFEDAKIKFNQSLNIFISHMHGDHVIGLPGLLFHFTLIQRTASVNIFGPPGIFAYLMTHKYITGLKAPFLNEIHEFHFNSDVVFKYDFQKNPDQAPQKRNMKDHVLYETEDYLIECAKMNHSVDTMGFKFVEKPRQGRFNVEKADELGIPRGRLWKKLQSGESITHDGKSIDPIKEGIIGPKRPGLSIAYSADTKYDEKIVEFVKDSDIFICEATYSQKLIDLATEKYHMTAEQAALIAKQASVKRLILTHISSRYAEGVDEKDLEEEAKAIFSDTTIAKDLMRFALNHDD